MTTSTTENDADVNYPLPLGCTNMLNRSNWNARRYTDRDNLVTLPTTHIVHQWIIISFTFGFIIKKNATSKSTAMTTSTTESDADINYPLPLGCTNMLNRSNWNARRYTDRDNLATLPTTHIVVRLIEGSNSTMNQQDCVKKIKK
ncbi:unnamed protein product [Rotaria sp. Silwood1]|nr:unnamed protein product [Rotaria sp. Silwood1]